MSRLCCALLALATLVIAFLGFAELAMAGFPDSYLTTYQRAANGLLMALTGLQGLLGAGLAVAALSPLPPRAHRRCAWAGAIALVLLLAITYLAVPAYFIGHLGLENGWGG